jgi:NAD(P)H-dependent flavin oxidoreductase YrpB (nitropropane dioxygenase family)
VGVLTSVQPGFAEPDYAGDPIAANLRAFTRNIRSAHEKLGTARGAGAGVIAVNILCAAPEYALMAEAAAEAGARVLISGAGIPTTLPGIVKDPRVKFVPVVSSARAIALLRRSWAKKYNRAPDAVIFEGPFKCGLLGFKEEQLDGAGDRFYQSMLEIRRELADLANCPLIVANGAMSRTEVKRAVSYGADGIQLEEPFALTRECAAPKSVLAMYTGANRPEALILGSPLGMPVRMLRNALAERILRGNTDPARCIGCIDVCPRKDIPFCLAEALAATAGGDAENGVLFCDEGGGNGPQPGTVADIFKELC